MTKKKPINFILESFAFTEAKVVAYPASPLPLDQTGLNCNVIKVLRRT